MPSLLGHFKNGSDYNRVLLVSLPPIFSFNPFFNYNKHDLKCKSDHVSALQKRTFHDSASLEQRPHSSMIWPQSIFPASPIFFQSPQTQHYSIFNLFYLFKLSMIAFASSNALFSAWNTLLLTLTSPFTS